MDHSIQLVVLDFGVRVFDVAENRFEDEGTEVGRSRHGKEGEQSFEEAGHERCTEVSFRTLRIW